MPIGKYLKERLTTLKPPLIVPKNPIVLLRLLNKCQWTFFLIALLAWTFDAFDFFSVTLNIIPIADTYGKTAADITWGITVTLMLRSIGAIIFGILGDKYGRKWPFIINILLYGSIEVLTGFCRTYEEFLIVRALFGIAMGGIYGNCVATGLEDAPIDSRGLLSGLLQQGYAIGYLLAAAMNLLIANNQRYGWRALFWFGGIPPILIALWRVFLPETQTFLQTKENREKKKNNQIKPSSTKMFLTSVGPALKKYWLLLVYLILMMSGFNFLAHGSQDLYPTFLQSQLKFDQNSITIATIVANCGAILGGTLIGYFSSFFGRRLSILLTLIIGACIIPAYLLPRDKTILIGAFFEQLCVQGAWGVVPIHLIELSPREFRSFVVGTSYQFGNLISSASSTIEATVGQRFPLKNSSSNLHDKHQFDYGKVMAIFLAATYVYLFILILFGPEKRTVQNQNLEVKDSESQPKELVPLNQIQTDA